MGFLCVVRTMLSPCQAKSSPMICVWRPTSASRKTSSTKQCRLATMWHNVAKSLDVKKATRNETWGQKAMHWVWVSPFPDPPRAGFCVKAQLDAHYGAGCLKHAEISSRTTRAGKAIAEKKRTAQGARKTRTASRASDSAASASVAAAAATTTESRTPAAAKVKESSDKDPLVRVLLFLTVCRCFV